MRSALRHPDEQVSNSLICCTVMVAGSMVARNAPRDKRFYWGLLKSLPTAWSNDL
jgi:hypothetical protein